MRKIEKREWIGTAVAVVFAVILFFGGTIWGLFSKGANSQLVAPVQNSTSTLSTSIRETMNNISTIEGLEIYDETVGTGTEAVAGKKVTAHYVGILTDGVKFDSSVDRGQPFQFTLGIGQVIQGWDKGIEGMKVGGIRRLVISPELGYGDQGAGELIPPGSTLIFQVQLLEVE